MVPALTEQSLVEKMNINQGIVQVSKSRRALLETADHDQGVGKGSSSKYGWAGT